MVCLVFFPFLSSLQVVVFWKRFMSASLSEVVKTVLMFIFLSTWKTTCLNAVILDHHFSLWHLVPYWETVKATLFFSSYLTFFFYLALKIRSLSLKSDIIRLFLYIDCFLLFFPFPFTHSWKFLLISWNFSSIISISKYIYFQFRLSDSIYQGHQSPLHWLTIFVYPPYLLLYI